MRFILFLLLIAVRAEAGLVAQGSGFHAGPSSVTSFGDTFTSSTAGSTLLVFGLATSTGIDPATVSCTDTVATVATNNTWQHSTARFISGADGLVIFYAYKSSSNTAPLVTGGTHVVTCTSASNIPTGKIYAFNGTVTSTDPMGSRQNGNIVGGTTGTYATGAVTPSAVGDLMFTALATRLIVNTTTPYTSSPIPADYTVGWVSGSTGGFGAGWALATSTTAVNNSWSMAAGSNNSVVQLIIFAGVPTAGVRRKVIP